MTDYDYKRVRLLLGFPEKLASPTIFHFGVRAEAVTSARLELLKGSPKSRPRDGRRGKGVRAVMLPTSDDNCETDCQGKAMLSQ